MPIPTLREVVMKSVLRPAGKCVLGAAAITVTVTLLLRLVISAWWLLNTCMVAAAMHPWIALPTAACIVLAAWCMVAKTCDPDACGCWSLAAKRVLVATCTASAIIGIASSVLFLCMLFSAATLTGDGVARTAAGTLPQAVDAYIQSIQWPTDDIMIDAKDGRLRVDLSDGWAAGDPDMAVCKALAGVPLTKASMTINGQPASAAACTWRFNNRIIVTLRPGYVRKTHP